MFFQNRSPGPFLEGPSAELLSKAVFWCHFSIFIVLQRAPFGHHFRPRWHQKWTTPNGGGHPFRDPAFHETTVILVPLGQ